MIITFRAQLTSKQKEHQMPDSPTKELSSPSGAKTTLSRRPTNDIEALLSDPDFKQKVAMALPKHMTPERLIRVACNALLKTPKLRDCSKASFLKAMLDLSSFGLEPDGRRAHLIPYGQDVQLIIDYKGLAELVRRSGDVSYIHADIVGENDLFEYQFGTGAKLVHKPKLNERGKIFCAYSFVRLKDGSEDFDVMDIVEINLIKERSSAYQRWKRDNSKTSPWITDVNEMMKKSVFRRHSKWLPLSPEIRNAMEYDEEPMTEQERFAASRPIFGREQQPDGMAKALTDAFSQVPENGEDKMADPPKDPMTEAEKDFLGV